MAMVTTDSKAKSDKVIEHLASRLKSELNLMTRKEYEKGLLKVYLKGEDVVHFFPMKKEWYLHGKDSVGMRTTGTIDDFFIYLIRLLDPSDKNPELVFGTQGGQEVVLTNPKRCQFQGLEGYLGKVESKVGKYFLPLTNVILIKVGK